jgi:hypothetical protein
MLARRSNSGALPHPTLLDRILGSRARRVAIVGLHPRAGSRTLVGTLARQLEQQGRPCAVTSFPRPALEDGATLEAATRLRLPAGTTLATVENAPHGEDVELGLVEWTRFATSLGRVGLYRVVREGEIELYGPAQVEALGDVLYRLADVSGGVALVDGAWDHRSFASPGITDGMVLVLGAGYSSTLERSAAAARYVVEVLGLAECSGAPRTAWPEAETLRAALALGARGQRLGTLPLATEPLLLALDASPLDPGAVLVLPRRLTDELMAPLVRRDARFTLVVRDATEVEVAPVYFKAWQKLGGQIQVAERIRVIAVATNPINAAGQDADPGEFRSLVTEAIPGLPVHDAVLESRPARRPVWKFWA